MQKELDFNQDCLITITHVDTSPDLKHATIYVSVLPDNRRGTALELLQRGSGRVKSVLAKQMRTKNIPNLHFKIDDQEVYAQGIDKILNEIKTEE